MIRAFLAIDLPASLRPGLARVQDELKQCGADVKWVPVGNVHLTLKFFGQILESQVADITTAAGEIARWQPPFALQVAGAGAFPSNRNPRVVWLAVHGDLDVLAGFFRQLEAAFGPLGFPPEDRPFSPHLTLGRMRSPAGRGELARCLATLPPPESAAFQVNEIILFRSNLSPQGATYSPLKVMPLGG